MIKWITPAAWLVFPLLLLLVFQPNLFGRLEGRFWPVVSAFKITSIVEYGTAKIDLYGTSQKVRNCDFERLEWRINNGSQSTPATVIFGEGTVLRPPGPLGFGPWVMDITKADLDRSFARVYHKCHWGWLTVTDFYP